MMLDNPNAISIDMLKVCYDVFKCYIHIFTTMLSIDAKIVTSRNALMQNSLSSDDVIQIGLLGMVLN